MYRKKKGKQNNIILGIVCFGLFLAVIGVNMFYNRDLNAIERMLKDTEVFVGKLFYAPISFVKDKISHSKTNERLILENKKLKLQNEQSQYNEAKIDELKSEVKNLKKQLDLRTTLGEKIVLHATVINRNHDGFYQTMNIDKGRENGLLEGMAVINSEGLIGVVRKTGGYSSTVSLLTSDTFDKISVRIKIEDHYVYGLLSGYKKSKNVFILEGVADNTEIPKDAVVTTTGMGKTFPAGLLVGKVKKVVTDNFDLAKIIEVTPSVNFNNLDYIAVVKRDESYGD